MKRLLKNPTALAGMAIIGLFLLTAALAPLVSPHDPTLQDLAQRLQPPGTEGHLLGTDRLGRDVLSRILYGARLSLLISISSVLIGMTIGVPLGLVSGYFGGRLDDLLMRLGDIQLSLPFILLVIAIIAALGPSLTNTILTLGVTSWVVYARVVRGSVLSLKEQDFVQAARALGAPTGRILTRHLLPNAAGPLIVVATLELARIIVSEAALSFLGLSGVPPEVPSWGQMLADGREVLYFGGWWVATFPGVAISLVVLGINLLGDALGEVLDPRSR
ncbi:ABC transporter permease [Oceanithermus desulfurans]|uniref:Peptide ABC transporter permease n=3 Tax=Oceanithermus TaxID=208447 RepID=A0A511RFZ9_9DEIN|nr:ABC transporter permease [Oceanithermus desulfurans]MBB6030897.1 peptide/nickel transport system permease protein [Oceanithermus desulfurans]GEM88568.1 peptide ABC transporter permease [Oceanithermus desulfurans NBRC 100063]